jgi:hypothetical protein
VLQTFGLLMVPALLTNEFMAQQQQQQLRPQQGWLTMPRAMLLLLQLSRASLWLLCGSCWWHEQVRMLAARIRTH